MAGKPDDAALAAGANLAAVGEELLQFGRAEPVAPRRFRLSRLLRGRRGTEWAAAGHATGETFVLIDGAALAVLEPPPQALGGQVRIQPHGIGDAADPLSTQRNFTGEALRPPPPVHLTADRQSDGTLLLSWVRRSRNGWLWLNGADTPLGEEREAYRVTISGAGGGRTEEVAAPSYTYAAPDQAADGIGLPLTVRVAQLGTWAPSREAVLILS